MSRPMPLTDRINYLEAAIESARHMQLRCDLPSFDQRRDAQRMADHIDGMLDQLTGCYLARSMGIDDSATLVS